jgi:hypothetical protein
VAGSDDGTAIMIPKAPIADSMVLRLFPMDHHPELRLLSSGYIMGSQGRPRRVSSDALSRWGPLAISSSTSESLNCGGSPDIGSYPCVLVVGDMVACEMNVVGRELAIWHQLRLGRESHDIPSTRPNWTLSRAAVFWPNERIARIVSPNL